MFKHQLSTGEGIPPTAIYGYSAGNAFAWRFLLGVVAALLSASLVHSQQAPAWRLPFADAKLESAVTPSLRIGIKDKASVTENILELSDVAELSGPENLVQSVRNISLGPAPINGKPQTWSQDEILRVLELRGIDSKTIRWAGADACQVSHVTAVAPERRSEFTQSYVTPQTIVQAERVVAGVVSAYLQKKTASNAGWTIKPIIPESHAKLLSQRYPIRGITGGEEPWLGRQRLTLLVTEGAAETALDLEVDIEMPPMVMAAVGPLSKGHTLDERDLKVVRLTPSMKAEEADCFVDLKSVVGKELRRNISSGQPVQRGDIGPPRVIQAKELIKIQVVSGSIMAETTGRSLQAGGVNELIEVEVNDSRKRLAGRIVAAGLVEVIAR